MAMNNNKFNSEFEIFYKDLEDKDMDFTRERLKEFMYKIWQHGVISGRRHEIEADLQSR